MFDFPTYIVSKLYEEYHEDHLVVENNLNMAGGLFKSPTSSPVHETKRQQQLQDRNTLLNGLNGVKPTAGKKLTAQMSRQLDVPAIKVSDADNPKAKRVL